MDTHYRSHTPMHSESLSMVKLIPVWVSHIKWVYDLGHIDGTKEHICSRIVDLGDRGELYEWVLLMFLNKKNLLYPWPLAQSRNSIVGRHLALQNERLFPEHNAEGGSVIPCHIASQQICAIPGSINWKQTLCKDTLEHLTVQNVNEKKDRVLGAQSLCVILLVVHLPCFQLIIEAWNSQQYWRGFGRRA